MSRVMYLDEESGQLFPVSDEPAKQDETESKLMDGVQCKKCRYLLKDKDGYNWCPNKIDYPDIDLIRDCKWYAVKTNADRIRSMTYEELAKWITIVQGDSWMMGYAGLLSVTYPNNEEDWLDWLRKEVE